jgi:hypothetical protein
LTSVKPPSITKACPKLKDAKGEVTKKTDHRLQNRNRLKYIVDHIRVVFNEKDLKVFKKMSTLIEKSDSMPESDFNESFSSLFTRLNSYNKKYMVAWTFLDSRFTLVKRASGKFIESGAPLALFVPYTAVQSTKDALKRKLKVALDTEIKDDPQGAAHHERTIKSLEREILEHQCLLDLCLNPQFGADPDDFLEELDEALLDSKGLSSREVRRVRARVRSLVGIEVIKSVKAEELIGLRGQAAINRYKESGFPDLNGFGMLKVLKNVITYNDGCFLVSKDLSQSED